MTERLEVIEIATQLIYYVFSSLMLFWALWKCFWDGKRNRIVLFILTALSNSMIGLFLAVYGGIAFSMSVIEPLFLRVLGYSMPYRIAEVTPFLIAGPLYIARILFMAWLCGKWLKVKNYSSVLFLFLMFGAVDIVAIFRDSGNINEIVHPEVRYIISIVGMIAAFVSLCLFYILDVKPFSKLAKVSAKVNWKIFNIPPIVFILVYTITAGESLSNNENELLLIMLFLFSTMIIFLFIWAFYVIIRNIHETNEAVKAKEEVKTLSVEVMEALAHTIDAKDEYTRGHSVRVAKYSKMLAEKLGLSKEDCDNVYYMGLLHDIGKIGVPNEIINSKSKLTEEEYAVIKTHPGVGYGILDEIKSRPDLSIGARWHHERYDGKGYPDGKAGEDIPFFARIIAVADSYDAMTSNRSYRHYLTQDAVRSEIQKNEGTQFDPKIAECMIELMAEDKNFEMHE